VCVGTDDHDLAAYLAPWAIIEPAELVDLAAELHPRSPADGNGARMMANLRRGSDWVAATPDPGPVGDGLLRILAAIAADDIAADDMRGAGRRVMLAGVPSIRDGAVDLLPPAQLATGSYRRLAAAADRLSLVDRVVVDVDSLTVQVATPLGRPGDSTAAEVWPLRSWRVDLPMTPLDTGDERGDGGHVAQTVAALAPLLDVVGVPGHDGHRGPHGALSALARLIERMPPEGET
jgi:hypothetical protein